MTFGSNNEFEIPGTRTIMSTYKIDNSFDAVPGMGRSLLQVYTGTSISENEAKALLRKIADHKWLVSEKLDRDVGFHVAAIDFVENFYEPQTVDGSGFGTFALKAFESSRSLLKKYLIAKGEAMPI